jgi:hypothetical protein
MVRTTAPFFSAPNGERDHRILFPGFDLQQIDQNIHHQHWQCRSQGAGPKRPKLARQKLESEDCPGIIKPARVVIGQKLPFVRMMRVAYLFHLQAMLLIDATGLKFGALGRT